MGPVRRRAAGGRGRTDGGGRRPRHGPVGEIRGQGLAVPALDALAQRAGGHVDPGQDRRRVALQACAEAAVAGQQLLLADDPGGAEHRVQQGRGVPLGEDQVVVARIVRVLPVVAQMAGHQHGRQVGGGRAGGGVAGPGRGAGADGVHAQLLRQLEDLVQIGAGAERGRGGLRRHDGFLSAVRPSRWNGPSAPVATGCAASGGPMTARLPCRAQRIPCAGLSRKDEAARRPRASAVSAARPYPLTADGRPTRPAPAFPERRNQSKSDRLVESAPERRDVCPRHGAARRRRPA